jgi:hypothetical protein
VPKLIPLARWKAVILTASILFFIQQYQSADDTDEEKTANIEPTVKKRPVAGDYIYRIEPYALSAYTAKNGYPKLVSKYKSRLREIETLRRKAAEMALDSGKCDIVEMSELSDKSSLQYLKFWVDCKNGQRIYLDETQIKSHAQVMTQAEKAWSKADSMRACQAAIKERALIPDALDIHSLSGTSFYKAPVTQNVVLQMDFDAKNAMGVNMPYTSTCFFEPGAAGSIEIKPRR